MNRLASIVVGLGFGDEGKGLATDYLCSKATQPLVIRFNGGQQAGHTVVMPDGRRHVFSNFGSGTLRGAATYWSVYCTCSLPNMLKERETLVELGVVPKLYLDAACALTTHYDALYNQLLEKQRGKGKHGSCGMGFGTTLQRQADGVSFTIADVADWDTCLVQLAAVREYYAVKAVTDGVLDFYQYDHEYADSRFAGHLHHFHQLLNDAFFITTEQEIFKNNEWIEFVFEGAQGILLDMDCGHFPHVTRSNTTSRNALEIIQRNKESMEPAELYYVSRCYHTRHGEGPFVQPADGFALRNNDAETNVFNPHQGNFRTGPLAIDQMQYALQCDDNFSRGLSKNLVVTCLDHLPEHEMLYTNQNGVFSEDVYSLPQMLNCTFHKTYFSHHPCSQYLVPKKITPVGFQT